METTITLENRARVTEVLKQNIRIGVPYGIRDIYHIINRAIPELEERELQLTADLALGIDLRKVGMFYQLKEDGTIYFGKMKKRVGHA